MKQNSLSVLVLASVLSGLSGCRWEDKALLGKDPRQAREDKQQCYGSSGHYVLAKESEVGPASCASPASLQAMGVETNGTLVVWMGKLTDGTYPSVQNLVYLSQSDNLSISFDCKNGTESLDGKMMEVLCKPLTQWRVSSTDLTSSDHRLDIWTVVFKNVNCGRSATFNRKWEYSGTNGCYGGSGTVYSGDRTYLRGFDIEIPHLWIESGAHGGTVSGG